MYFYHYTKFMEEFRNDRFDTLKDDNDFIFEDKSDLKLYIFASLFPVMLLAGTIAVPFGIKFITDKIEENGPKYHVYNAITISDGQVTRVDNIYGDKAYHVSYRVLKEDEDSLVVYVYGPNDNDRYLLTEFIESNIYVTENNGEYIVSFDKENITQKNYNSFVEDFDKDNNENQVQRVRN